MSDQFTFSPAKRGSVKPLIGVFGRSGSGKTMSALLLARGLVGPNGRVGLIDTENKRGSIFADLIPGGYNTLDLDAPFSPDRYIECVESAEKQADVLVIDSASHCWQGDGGVLDWQEDELQRMAGDDWKKREACRMASWIKPKMSFKKMVLRLLRCSLPLIICLRAEEKTHIEKGRDGKNKVITDDFSTPIFDSRFIFELLLNLETIEKNGKGGYCRIRKVTHPDIWDCLPKDGEQIGIKHGQAIAKWSAAGQTSKPQQSPARSVESQDGGRTTVAPAASGDPLTAAKKALWSMVKKDFDSVAAFETYLLGEGLLSDTETLADLGVDRLKEITEKMKP